MIAFEQDPNEILDYEQPVSGDTIVTATWAIAPAATLEPIATGNNTATRVRVSGLTEGQRYTLTVTVQGASGQRYERSAIIRAKHQ